MKFLYKIIIIILLISYSVYSDNKFEILYPNGGETLYSGETTEIFWNGLELSESVSVEYSTDNGMTWKSASDSKERAFFYWDIPDINSDSCLIRVNQQNPIETKPKLEWEKFYGGSSVEESPYIKLTKDGGYILYGTSSSNDGDVEGHVGDRDFWVLKINNKGKIEWSKVYGGSSAEFAGWIEQTPDGGYIITGETISNNGDVGPRDNVWYDAWILKLDENGNVEWKNTYGGSDSDNAISIVNSDDNGYIVAGYTYSDDGDVPNNKGAADIWVFKLNNLGKMVWSKTYGGSEMDQAYTMDKTSDGGVIIAGRTGSDFGGEYNNIGGWDYIVLKLDSNGEKEWLKTYGGLDTEIPQSIISLKDGGYAVVGYTFSEYVRSGVNKGDADAWILRLFSDGEIYWGRVYGGTYTDVLYTVCEAPDGGLIVGGFSTSDDGEVGYNGGDEDYWIMKLGDFGNIVWSETYGEESFARLTSIQMAQDGGIVAVGTRYFKDEEGNYNSTISDWWLMKFQSNFNPLLSDESDSVFSITKRFMKSNIDHINMGEVSVGESKDTIISSALCNVTNHKLYINSIVMKDDKYNEFSVKLSSGLDYLEANECVDLKFEYKPLELGEKYVEAEFNTSVGNLSNAIYIEGTSGKVIEKERFSMVLMPSVASTSIFVSIYFEKDDYVTLQVFDTQGRRIEELYSGLINEGYSEYVIDLSNYKNSQYYLQLISTEIIRTAKFEVVK